MLLKNVLKQNVKLYVYICIYYNTKFNFDFYGEKIKKCVANQLNIKYKKFTSEIHLLQKFSLYYNSLMEFIYASMSILALLHVFLFLLRPFLGARQNHFPVRGI